MLSKQRFEMKKKYKCPICNVIIEKGTGCHYRRRLIHKKCKEHMKIHWQRYVKRSPTKRWKW